MDPLLEEAYLKRLEVNALRREVYENPDPNASALMDALQRSEAELSALELRRSSAVRVARTATATGATEPAGAKGAQTTGLEATVTVHLSHIPTAVYQFFDPDEHPLMSCTVHNTMFGNTRRVRVSSFIEGFSARSVETFELDGQRETTVRQSPTLFAAATRDVTERTSATLNVTVEDMDGAVELNRTEVVRLLARTTAPLAVEDPSTGGWTDLTRYFGAFVTPNAPTVMSFLRTVADRHPDRRLVGYQGSQAVVEPQVRAVFDALSSDADIAYVNSVIAFSPDDGGAMQRVRLPRESLADRQANCADGTVLVASLLEAVSMSPAIVVVPGHTLVAWETWQGSDEWRYLETTMIGSATFDQACASAERTVARYRALAQRTGDPFAFRQWPLRTLRAQYRITPME